MIPSGEDEGEQRSFDFGNPLLDEVGVVTRASTAINPATPSSSSPSGDSDGSEHGECVAIAEQAQVDSLVHMQQAFQREGADPTVAEFICGS